VTRKANRGWGHPRYNQYDDADRLVAVTDAAQNSTVYGYDIENNIVGITDAANHHRAFACDALGEICKMVARSFKAQVSVVAQHCMLSVPAVVSGKDYQLDPLVDGLRIQVSKTFEGALIWIALDLHRN